MWQNCIIFKCHLKCINTWTCHVSLAFIDWVSWLHLHGAGTWMGKNRVQETWKKKTKQEAILWEGLMLLPCTATGKPQFSTVQWELEQKYGVEVSYHNLQCHYLGIKPPAHAHEHQQLLGAGAEFVLMKLPLMYWLRLNWLALWHCDKMWHSSVILHSEHWYQYYSNPWTYSSKVCWQLATIQH